jgi:hypothetical protein
VVNFYDLKLTVVNIFLVTTKFGTFLVFVLFIIVIIIIIILYLSVHCYPILI